MKEEKAVKEVKKSTKKFNKNTLLEVVLFTLWAGASLIISEYIMAFPFVWIFGAEAVSSSAVLLTLYSALSYVLAAILVIFVPKLVKKKYQTNREELGLTGLPTFTDIGISILGIIATFVIAGLLTSLLSLFPWFDAEQAQDVGYSTNIVGFDRIVAFLSLVVIAPLFEELTFRGWLYGKLKSRTPVAVAIAIVLVLFGALHGQLNVGVTVGVMSVVMCIEREITGTIYAGVLTHMLKNGIAFWLLFVL